MRLTLIINMFHFQIFGVKRREKKSGNTLRLVRGAHNWLEELKIGSSLETKYPQTVKLTRLFEIKVISIFVVAGREMVILKVPKKSHH